MALSDPKTIYGIHSLTLYNRSTFEPYGILKVLGSVNFSFAGDFTDLYGGSNRFPWDSEGGVLSVEITGTIKEVPNFAFEKFLSGTVTETSAEASGNITALANKSGTSVLNATTGIASVTLKTAAEAELKSGLYVLKAASATTVDLYCMSDYDFTKGTDEAYETDLLKVNPSAITIVDTGATVDVDNFGLTLTSGSGTVAMTTGDTAYFYVRKVNTGSDVISLGEANLVFPEFGAMIASQQKGNGDTFEVQMYKCKAIGLPLGFNEQSWLESDVNIRGLYDSTEGKVAQIRRITG